MQVLSPEYSAFIALKRHGSQEEDQRSVASDRQTLLPRDPCASRYVLERPSTASGLQGEGTDSRTALPQVAELALNLDRGEEVSPGREAELSVRAPTADSSAGVLWRVPGIYLPPGRYEALLCLGMEGTRDSTEFLVGGGRTRRTILDTGLHSWLAHCAALRFRVGI